MAAAGGEAAGLADDRAEARCCAVVAALAGTHSLDGHCLARAAIPRPDDDAAARRAVGVLEHLVVVDAVELVVLLYRLVDVVIDRSRAS